MTPTTIAAMTARAEPVAGAGDDRCFALPDSMLDIRKTLDHHLHCVSGWIVADAVPIGPSGP